MSPDSSNAALWIAMCGILLQLVGFFVIAWKNEKDKKDDANDENISNLKRDITRIDTTLDERDRRYDERFKRLEREL